MQPAALTTGVPWLDYTLATLAAIGALCTALSHFFPPTTWYGAIISWGAGNLGKTLVKQDPNALPAPRGFARTTVLTGLAALSVLVSSLSVYSCATFHSAEQASSDCAGVQNQLPSVVGAIVAAIVNSANQTWEQDLQNIESAGGETVFWCAYEIAENVVSPPAAPPAASAPAAAPASAALVQAAPVAQASPGVQRLSLYKAKHGAAK